MTFRLNISLLLLAFIGFLQVLAAPSVLPGSVMAKVEIKGTATLKSGGYYYSHWVPDAGTYTDAEVEKMLYEAGVRGMKAMQSQATADGKNLPAVVAPAYFPKQGWTVVSSIKGLPVNTQSPQTCSVVEDGNHLRFANCAEINVMALAMTKGKAWLEDTNVRIAAFSNKKTFYAGVNKGKTGYGYIAPCNEGVHPDDGYTYDGCKQSLAKYSNWKAFPANTLYDSLTL